MMCYAHIFLVERKAEELAVLCKPPALRAVFFSLRTEHAKTRPAARSAAMAGSTWCASAKVLMARRFAHTSSNTAVANSNLHAMLLRARN